LKAAGAPTQGDAPLRALLAEVDKLMLPEMPPNYPPMMLYDRGVNSSRTAGMLEAWRSPLLDYPAVPVVYGRVHFCDQISVFYMKKPVSAREAEVPPCRPGKKNVPS